MRKVRADSPTATICLRNSAYMIFRFLGTARLGFTSKAENTPRCFLNTTSVLRVAHHYHECCFSKTIHRRRSQKTNSHIFDPLRKTENGMGISKQKKPSLHGPQKRRETPTIHLFDLKIPQNIRPFESDMPTTFFLEPRPYVFSRQKRFGRTQRFYVERRGATSSFRLCPAGSGQEVGG